MMTDSIIDVNALIRYNDGARRPILSDLPSFVDAALKDLRDAQRMLARHPALAETGWVAALVLGDVQRMARALEESPEIATRNGGRRVWPPLVYVCFSRFAGDGSRRAGDLAETARLLFAQRR